MILVDLDNDRDLDSVSLYQTAVHVKLNDSQGVFTSVPISFPVPQGVPYANMICAADLDGDGFEDVCVGGYKAVYVLRNTGFQGVLFGAVSYSLPSGDAYAITASDINGDNHADVIVAADVFDAGAIHLYLNTGNRNGTLASPSSVNILSTPFSVVIADINGDGHGDVVAPNLLNDSVSVLLNDGQGILSQPTNFAVVDGPWGIAIDDLDSDGDDDIAVTNTNSIVVSILRNTGSLPSISQHPEPQVTAIGTSTSLSVTAAGGPSVSFQWRFGGVALVDGPTIHGTMTLTLSFDDVSIANAGVYDVVVTNGCGSVTSAAVAITVTSQCPSDVNGDGWINVDDLLAVINGWGVCP